MPWEGWKRLSIEFHTKGDRRNTLFYHMYPPFTEAQLQHVYTENPIQPYHTLSSYTT